MGDINPNVFSLAETLAAVGADWLAFELVEAIRRGRPIAHVTEKSREIPRVLDAWEGETLSPQERQLIDHGTEPIPADEQTAFAANYVFERLSEAIEMTAASLENLDRIASAFPDKKSEIDDPLAARVTLGLEGSDFRFTGAERDRLQSLLHALDASLKEWTVSTLEEERANHDPERE